MVRATAVGWAPPTALSAFLIRRFRRLTQIFMLFPRRRESRYLHHEEPKSTKGNTPKKYLTPSISPALYTPSSGQTLKMTGEESRRWRSDCRQQVAVLACLGQKTRL